MGQMHERQSHENELANEESWQGASEKATCACDPKVSLETRSERFEKVYQYSTNNVQIKNKFLTVFFFTPEDQFICCPCISFDCVRARNTVPVNFRTSEQKNVG